MNDVLPIIADRLHVSIEDVPYGRENDTPTLIAHTDLAKVLVGWEAKVGLAEGIDLAIEEWKHALWPLMIQTSDRRPSWTQKKPAASATN